MLQFLSRLLLLLYVLLMTASFITAQDDVECPETLDDYQDMEQVIEQLSDCIEFEDGEYLVEDEVVSLDSTDGTDKAKDLGYAEDNLIMAANITVTASTREDVNVVPACQFLVHQESLPSEPYWHGAYSYLYFGGFGFGYSSYSARAYQNTVNFQINGSNNIEGVGNDNDADHLLMITYDKQMWVYVNGTLELEALPLFRNEGTISVKAYLKIACEFENIYAYTWED